MKCLTAENVLLCLYISSLCKTNNSYNCVNIYVKQKKRTKINDKPLHEAVKCLAKS